MYRRGSGAGGSMYGEAQSIIGNGHMGPPHPHNHNDRQTPVKILPSCSSVGGR